MMLPTFLQSSLLAASLATAVAVLGSVECRQYFEEPEEDCTYYSDGRIECHRTGEMMHGFGSTEGCGGGSGENLASNLLGRSAAPVRPVAAYEDAGCRACGGTSTCHGMQTGPGHVGCDGGGGAMSNEKLEEIRAGVRMADAALLTGIITSTKGVSFNTARGSIQTVGCNGKTLVHNIELSRALASQLEAALSE